jgi:cytochrome c556
VLSRSSARGALMKAYTKSVYGDLSKMVKGTRAYDQAVVDAALVQLQDASQYRTVVPAQHRRPEDSE